METKRRPLRCTWNRRKRWLISPSTPHAFAARFLRVVMSCMGARKIPGVACLEHFSRSGCGHRFKVYPIAEPLNPLGQPIDRIMPPPFVEVARAHLVMRFLAAERVQDTAD